MINYRKTLEYLFLSIVGWVGLIAIMENEGLDLLFILPITTTYIYILTKRYWKYFE